jgi:hypothetical protein
LKSGREKKDEPLFCGNGFMLAIGKQQFGIGVGLEKDSTLTTL